MKEMESQKSAGGVKPDKFVQNMIRSSGDQATKDLKPKLKGTK